VKARPVLGIVSYLTIAILVMPTLVIILTSFTSANYVTFPPHGFTFRWYGEALSKREYLESFYLSAFVAIIAAAISTIFGTLVGIGLVRYRFVGRNFVQIFFISPLVVPTIVIGIALLQFFNQLGIGTSLTGLIVGHIIITIPFVIRLVAASLAGVDRNFALAATNLGAGPLQTFRRITAPLIAPGIAAGAVFAFITSFDNVTISVFLSSARAVTLPVRIYAQTDQPVYPWLIAICSLNVFFSIAVILVAERLVGIGRFYFSR
jgi:putative spermidine/putrescine transport system permease protein